MAMTTDASRNKRLALGLVGIVAGMVALAFASVPLYRVFCQVTGLGGTTQVAERASETVVNRQVTVRFNADIDPELPWAFYPDQKEITVNIGETALISYTARNMSDQPVTGTAVFNVTPLKAGLYFNKIQCFCFEDQRLEPGQKMHMPVSLFVDPEMLEDPNARDVTTITLSYTFFRVKDEDSRKKKQRSNPS